ncbi:MAG: flagellar basal body P-ring formation chaperone FlgA [Pseudomonadota bacterium]
MNKFAGIIATSILASDMFSAAAAADSLIAARNIRAGSVITASDIVSPNDIEAMRRAVNVIGMEAVRTFYEGQPLREDDLRKPTLVKRNAIVQMEFAQGAMTINAEGRALDQGGLGDRVRVMNLISKRVVVATVAGNDIVRAKS